MSAARLPFALMLIMLATNVLGWQWSQRLGLDLDLPTLVGVTATTWCFFVLALRQRPVPA